MDVGYSAACNFEISGMDGRIGIWIVGDNYQVFGIRQYREAIRFNGIGYILGFVRIDGAKGFGYVTEQTQSRVIDKYGRSRFERTAAYYLIIFPGFKSVNQDTVFFCLIFDGHQVCSVVALLHRIGFVVQADIAVIVKYDLECHC